jgi:hypothetical protein
MIDATMDMMLSTMGMIGFGMDMKQGEDRHPCH